MARSRKQAWLRDELILALDLSRREGRNPPPSAVQEISDLLRSIPIERELAEEPGFRNAAAVSLKVYNFVSIDPAAETAGMSRGGRGDQDVWDEFAEDPLRLAAVAAAIRANLYGLTPAQADEEEDDVEDAPEGAVLTRTHRVRERNTKAMQRRKEKALAADGRLACEGCGFDFAAVYGERGEGFIECHHTIPLATMPPSGARTRPEDLALVCSNCHRIVHRRSPWLTMDELRALVASALAGGS